MTSVAVQPYHVEPPVGAIKKTERKHFSFLEMCEELVFQLLVLLLLLFLNP